jgi:hypothetical protein
VDRRGLGCTSGSRESSDCCVVCDASCLKSPECKADRGRSISAPAFQFLDASSSLSGELPWAAVFSSTAGSRGVGDRWRCEEREVGLLLSLLEGRTCYKTVISAVFENRVTLAE